MATFIIPTANIIRQFQNCESLFAFYEHGVKGIVRDAVLLRDPSESFEALGPDNDRLSALVDKIVRDYDNSSESVYYRYSENTCRATQVEMVAFAIMSSVNDMMAGLFVNDLYDICLSRYDWLGNDIIIKMTLLEEKPSNVSRKNNTLLFRRNYYI